MWRTGLRIGEALALSARDVNLGEGVLWVQHGKGDKARRLGIDAGTLSELELWLAVRPRSEFLFCTLRGGELDQGYVRKMMSRLKKRTGVEGRVHPHALRHTFSAEMVREGAPITTLRDALGHTDLRVTDRYLQGIHPSAVIDAMSAREWKSA
jgi:integrase